MGKIFCLMGKSNSGKDTIFKELMKDKGLELKAIVSYTTRPIRTNECDGREYYFIDEITLQKYRNEGKVIEERNYNRDEYRFIEIKQNEYYQPSLVYVQSIYPPFNTEKISLEKYWDTYEFKEEFKNLDESFFDEDVNINALEVINIDYINGLIKLKDKYTGRIFTKKRIYNRLHG